MRKSKKLKKETNTSIIQKNILLGDIVFTTLDGTYGPRYLISAKMKIEARERAEAQERYRKAEFERFEQERRIRLENSKINFLIEQAEAFQRSKYIKEFIEALKAKIAMDAEETKKYHDQWIKWATEIANRLNPVNRDFLRNWCSEFEE